MSRQRGRFGACWRAITLSKSASSPEDTFGELVTYPAITVVCNTPPGRTEVKRRDGSLVTVSCRRAEPVAAFA